MKLKEFLERWEWKNLEEANNNLEETEKRIYELCMSVNLIDKLKSGREELLGKSYKQIIDGHKPAFCNLAGRDCPALNESKIRADERRKVCQEIREKAFVNTFEIYSEMQVQKEITEYTIREDELDKIEKGESE